MTAMIRTIRQGYLKEVFELQTYKNLLYFVVNWLPFIPLGFVLFESSFISGGSSQAVFVSSISTEQPESNSLLFYGSWLVGIVLFPLLVWLILQPLRLTVWFQRFATRTWLGADTQPPLRTGHHRGWRKFFSLPHAREVAFVLLTWMFSGAMLLILGSLLYITATLLSAPLIAAWQPPASTFSYWRDSLLWTGSQALRLTAASSAVAFVAGIPMLVLTLQAVNTAARVWRTAAERAFSNDKSSQKAVRALEQAANSVLTQNTQASITTILQSGLEASSATGAGIGEIRIGLSDSDLEKPHLLRLPLEQNAELCVLFPYRASSRDTALWRSLGVHASTALKLQTLLGAEREQERSRIARELHDSVAQALYGIALGTRSALEQLSNPEQAQKALEYARDLADAGTSEMKTLLFALRPDALEEGGLAAALHKLGEMLQARYKLSAVVDAPLEPSLPLEVKGGLYRIAQEAAHNTVKHAKASQVWIELAASRLEVRDDGRGFDVLAPRAGAIGLKSMRERAESFGGVVQVVSSEKGTQIVVEFGGKK
jgi:signal transduction histidine kinase